jgi:hypothetical protein
MYWCVDVLMCYVVGVLAGGVRVKRSVKMSQSLPASGKSLPVRDALSELGFGESKSPEKGQEGEREAGGTRMSLKKQSRQQQAQEEEEGEEVAGEVAEEERRGREGRVMAALQQQVEALQGELAGRAEQQSKLADQLRRREEEWLRVSRQVREGGRERGREGGSDLRCQLRQL